MPNRILKESILSSEQIDQLTWFEEVLFYRLIVSADDYGCMDGRAAYLKSVLFPLKDTVTKQAIEKAIAKLVSTGLLIPYMDDASGNAYLFLPTWCKHQRLRNSKHKYPMPKFDESGNVISDLRQLAASCGKLPQVAASRGSRTRACTGAESESESESEIESESEGEPPYNPPTGEVAVEILPFETFWTAYPKKVAKKDAVRAFQKLTDNDKVNIMPALERQKQSFDWTKDGGRYVPNPATYLNGRRWEDEISDHTPTGKAAQDFNASLQAAARWMQQTGEGSDLF